MAATPSRRVSSGERINAAEPSGHLQDALRQRRIRLTRQRRVILQVMDSAEQHLDVDQILERAQRIDPEVTSAATATTTKRTAPATTSTSPVCAAAKSANSSPASTNN
jgi:hypothetical protein